MDILRETKKDYLAAERLAEALPDYIDRFSVDSFLHALYGETILRRDKAEKQIKKLMEKGE